MKKDTLQTAIALASLAALGDDDTYLAPALRVIDEGGLREHIQTLASDEFEERATMVTKIL